MLNNIKNISANVLGALLNGVLIIVTVPMYFLKLGEFGFGIYSFWQVLQLTSAVFDSGIGGTVSKKIANKKNNENQSDGLASTMFTFECVYGCIGILFGLLMWSLVGYITDDWLRIGLLDRNREAANIIRSMVPALVLFFFTSLYTNAMIGLQIHVKSNLISSLFNIIRQIIAVFVLVSTLNLGYVFVSMAVVYAIQLIIMYIAVWNEISGKKYFNKREILENGKYTTGLAIATALSVAVASLDRLMVSKLLSIEDLGYYSLAFTATGTLQMIFVAFYRTYYPRFCQLSSASNKSILINEYMNGCSVMGWVLMPVLLYGFAFAPQIFNVWIGNQNYQTVLSFRIILIGTFMSGLMWVPIAYQQALGVNKLHNIMLVLALVFGFPVCYFGIEKYGISGAGFFWIFHGFSELIIGIWLTNKILPFVGNIRSWYEEVVVKPAIISGPIVIGLIALLFNCKSEIYYTIAISLAFTIQMIGQFCMYRRRIYQSRTNT